VEKNDDPGLDETLRDQAASGLELGSAKPNTRCLRHFAINCANFCISASKPPTTPDSPCHRSKLNQPRMVEMTQPVNPA